jgi:hypothetical protein
MLTAAQIDQFKRDGFLLMKRVFSADEVQRFHVIGEGASKSTDLSALPGLESLWADERLVETAKQLLGAPITYFGEASFQRQVIAEGERPMQRALHHDAKGTLDHLFNRQHPPTPEPYPIVRFALYLQDHASQSGGLKLVPGSHQMDSSDFNQASLKFFNVPSEPGDAVVFCNKILHTAHALRLTKSPDVALSAMDEDLQCAARPDDFLPAPRDRRAIFIDFAGANALADIYIKGRALHPLNVRDGFVEAILRGHVRRDAQRMDVKLRFDAAVVEAVAKLTGTAVNGMIGETAVPLLTALPTLCGQSRAWSSHFNFVPDVPANTSAEAALGLLNQLVPRIEQLRQLGQTARRDQAMRPGGKPFAPQ